MNPASNIPISCGECGSDKLHWDRVDSEVPFHDRAGLRHVAIAHVPRGTCSACGAHVFPYEALVLQHEAVCRSLGVLTPREIVEGRRRLRISQERFAELASLGVASIRRWERGASIQSKSSDRLLRNALRQPVAERPCSAIEDAPFVFKPRSAEMKRLHGSPGAPPEGMEAEQTQLPSFSDQRRERELS